MLIGWDKASKEGDFTAKIYGKIKGGELHIKKVKYYKSKPIKEVKKVNKIPYFELKVVKVKGVKEEKLCTQYCTNPRICSYQKFEENKSMWEKFKKEIDLHDSDLEYSKCYELMEKIEKGLVNGENLDKIKFPCFCSYKSQRYPMKGKRFAGMIFQNENYYYLFDIHDQYQEKVIARHWYKELKYMIKEYDIHILKGKVIIFEEEE